MADPIAPKFEGRFISQPQAFEGDYRIEGETLVNAFSQALQPGHEKELQLAFRLVWFRTFMSPAELARAVADLYELAELRAPQAKLLNLKGRQEPEGAPR